MLAFSQRQKLKNWTISCSCGGLKDRWGNTICFCRGFTRFGLARHGNFDWSTCLALFVYEIFHLFCFHKYVWPSKDNMAVFWPQQFLHFGSTYILRTLAINIFLNSAPHHPTPRHPRMGRWGVGGGDRYWFLGCEKVQTSTGIKVCSPPIHSQ